MGVNSLPKTVTGQRHGCDLNSGATAPANHSASEPQVPHAADRELELCCVRAQ